MASSGVRKGHLWLRTIKISGYCEGNDVNRCVRKSRLVIASSAWSSCVRMLPSMVKYALSGSASLVRHTQNWRMMSCLPI